jgi:cyclohexyl-isocyanide hydratase
MDVLPLLGATPVDDRVVIDHNRITGGGVTAGVDFALVVARELCGSEVAQKLQLMLEYDPAPPFKGGSPRSAPASLTQSVRLQLEPSTQARLAAAERVAGRNGWPAPQR